MKVGEYAYRQTSKLNINKKMTLQKRKGERELAKALKINRRLVRKKQRAFTEAFKLTTMMNTILK